MKNQWGKWNSKNHIQYWWTCESLSETIQTMASNDEPVNNDVKQHKPCPERMKNKAWCQRTQTMPINEETMNHQGKKM